MFTISIASRSQEIQPCQNARLFAQILGHVPHLPSPPISLPPSLTRLYAPSNPIEQIEINQTYTPFNQTVLRTGMTNPHTIISPAPRPAPSNLTNYSATTPFETPSHITHNNTTSAPTQASVNNASPPPQINASTRDSKVRNRSRKSQGKK